MKSNNILVTGSHRSGSTWVGKMLALSEAFILIKKNPFNVCFNIYNALNKY